MRIRYWAFFGPLSVMLVLLASADAACQSLITAPRQPIAGHGFTLIFPGVAPGGRDLDSNTVPSIEVVGNVLRVHTRAECEQAFCDVLATLLFRVEVPALAAGTYSIEVLPHGSGSPAAPMSITVVDGLPEPVVQPANGFWYDQRRPGSGFYLQTRGSTLAIAALNSELVFDGLDPVWRIDATTLHGRSAAVVVRRLRTQFGEPNCIECDSTVHPELALSTFSVAMEFESERRARATLSNGKIVALISLPMGANYVPITIADTVDAEFGSLPLPDVSGRWAFDHPSGLVELSIGAAVVSAGQAVFSIGGGSINCASQRVNGRAACQIDSPGTQLHAAFALLGDVGEQRILLRQSAGQGTSETRFSAQRLN